MKILYMVMVSVVALGGSAFSADAVPQPAAQAAVADGTVAATAADNDWRSMIRKVMKLSRMTPALKVF